jgi:hypothetical protein
MGNDDTENLSAKVGEVVGDEGRKTDLLDNIAPSVDGRSADALGPDNEHERHIVGPAVDTREQVVSELGAVGDRKGK